MEIEPGVIIRGADSQRIGHVGAKFLFNFYLGQLTDIRQLHMFMVQCAFGPFSGLLANIDPSLSYPAINMLNAADLYLEKEEKPKKPILKGN